jgi:hypothetical protein
MVPICGNEDMNKYFVSVTHDYTFAVKAETPQAAEAIVEKAWDRSDIYVTAPENDGFVESENTDYTSELKLLESSQTFYINSVEASTD